MFSRTAWLTGIGPSKPRGPGFHGGGRGLGARDAMFVVLSAMGRVICGGGLAFCVIVAYEKLPGAEGAEAMEGVEELELTDLCTSLSPRKISLIDKMLAPVFAISCTVGYPSRIVIRRRMLSSLSRSSKKGAYPASWETPKSICLQL